jgi:hypothetical protein
MVQKASGSTSIQDEDTGLKAKVEAKGSGENAVHVISDATVVGSNGQDFYLAVPAGLITDTESVNKFGFNPDVNGSNFEEIWDVSTSYTWKTSASTVTVKSDDSSDTSAGSGARTVEIQGLDGSYNPISETITMNGTSNVTSSNSYLRIFRMKVLTAGSQEENDGDITATHTGTVIAQISEENNQTLMAVYTVKSGYTAYLTSFFIGMERNVEAAIRLDVRPEGSVFQVKRYIVSDSATESLPFKPYLKIEEKSDIRMMGKAQSGSQGISAGFDLILVKN